MAELQPNATFDSLFLATRLQSLSGSVSMAELHLFAYLSCLLWLYTGRSVADWGYVFVGTELGAPFSNEINTALVVLEDRGLLWRSEDRLTASPLAASLLGEFEQLEMNRPRIDCLSAAWSSTIALSPGMVGSALTEEGELVRARSVPVTRRLLEEAAVAALHDQFEAIKIVLKEEGNDLRVPSIVWLQALHTMRASAAE